MYNLVTRNVQDKNNYDIDDQKSRQIHKGFLQNYSEIARTDVYTEYSEETM